MRFALVFAAALALAVPARANPCRDDAKKFCANIRPGGGRIVRCLEAHADELSDGCKARRAKVKQRAEEVHSACKADAENFCGNMRAGRGRIARCMRRHWDQLSEGCKAAIKPQQARKGAPAQPREHYEDDDQ